ncbi:MAG: YhcH/YjgK/YiaL family protein [Oscillospiraceae bacterium]|nr:YhcH/YjgK/YiaL family protein [Oscillospiraceae bacterium]
MILDRIDNYKLYTAGNELFEKAFAFLLDYVADPKPVGRYEIDGDKVFAMVSEYETKLESMVEAHNNYIDIQFLDGECEKIEYVLRENLPVKVPYVEDIEFYEDTPYHSPLILRKHDFVILYPHDSHKPGLAVDKPIPVKKVVVKVKA